MKIGLVSDTIWPGSLHREDLQRFGIIDFFDIDPFIDLIT